MNTSFTKYWNRLAGVGLVTLLTAGFATVTAAQSVAGKAFCTYVQTPVASSGRTALVVLPAVSGTDGSEADGSGGTLDVPGALSAEFLKSITSGELGAAESGAQSTSSAENVNVLDGLITADALVANVRSRVAGGAAVSDADGSTFSNLVVAGVPVTSGDGAVEPNTRIDLSGVGYVVLNEQLRSGDGVSSSGLTVNMIHVYLKGLLGATTGEIIVGSATSKVQ
ncbi:MAG TPA: choice-of-anchor P family protein [Gemmatimonadales bacterium]